MQSYTRVRHIIEDKGDEVLSTAAGESARECARLMMLNDVGSLLVLADGGVVGIVTWHDIVAGLAKSGGSLADMTAAELMTEVVRTTTEDAQLEEVEALMSEEHIRHLPVMRGDRVVGLVTLLDVLRLHLSRSDALGQQLVDYVSGYPS